MSSSPGVAGSLIALALVSAATFLLIYAIADRRRVGRPATSVLVTALSCGSTAAYARWAALDGMSVLSAHARSGLLWGAVIGILAGVPMASVAHLAHRSSGSAFGWALSRDVVMFGAAEGLLLNGLPALIGWQVALGLGFGPVATVGLSAGCSVLVVLADHLAYPETRRAPTLLGVAVAGAALGAGVVLTGSILTAVVAHVVVHLCVVLRGGEVPPYDVPLPSMPVRTDRP